MWHLQYCMNAWISACLCCSYSILRRQPPDVFQGHIYSHNPQDELVLRFLRKSHTKEQKNDEKVEN